MPKIVEEKNALEESKALLLMKEVPFNLYELKVLETYLSKINARDDTQRTVTFSKKEYEELMGISEVKSTALKKYVESLQGKIIYLPDEDKKGEWKMYTLFSLSQCYKDKTSGELLIELTCSVEAKKIFFNLENTGYIRYQLRNVINLTKRYSYFLYMYLINNKYQKKWKVDLETLRNALHIGENKYDEYKSLNQLVIKPSADEVNKKTDLTFKYSPVRNGRKIAAIEFTIIKDNVKTVEEINEEYLGNNKYHQVNAKVTDEGPLLYKDNNFERLAECCSFEFDNEKIELISRKLEERLTQEGLSSSFENQLELLSQCYNELKRRSSNKNLNKIKSRCSYICKLISSIDISKLKLSLENKSKLSDCKDTEASANTAYPIQENNEKSEALRSEDDENKYSDENIEFLAEACNNEFSDTEMQLLFYILVLNASKIPPHKMGMQFANYHYLITKYTEMNIYSTKKKIDNRFSYLKKMIENDLESK